MAIISKELKPVRQRWSSGQLDFVKEFILNKESDIARLPSCCVGSKATVTETNNRYVCCSDGTWKLESVAMDEGTSSGGGSGGGAMIVNFTAKTVAQTSTGYTYSDVTVDKSSDEIIAAYESGIPVIGYFKREGSTYVLNLTHIDNKLLTFTGFMHAFNNMSGAFSAKWSVLLLRMSSTEVDAAQSFTILS